ncbi:MAG: ligand-binding sensor domain-containing protein [Treponema sp.]
MFYGEYHIPATSNVYCITQDSSDRLYLGTDSGLVRYDGVSVYRYEHMPFDDSTISSCQVTTCYMETDDMLWLGTQAGLDKLDTGTGRISHYPDAGEMISAIFRDSKGRLWIGSAQGLSLCTDEESKTFTVFNTKDAAHYLGAAAVYSVSEDSKGRIFASTDDGVWEYNPAADTFEKTSLIPPGCLQAGTNIYAFIEDKGTYWMAAWGVGLFIFSPILILTWCIVLGITIYTRFMIILSIIILSQSVRKKTACIFLIKTPIMQSIIQAAAKKIN